jgi:hypothetical protein
MTCIKVHDMAAMKIRHCVKPHKNRTPASFAIICAMLFCFFNVTLAAQKQMSLTGISVERDSTTAKGERVNFSFEATPAGFPVYTMSDPLRIVVDLPDTKAADSLKTFVPESWFIRKAAITPINTGNENDCRIELFLKENVSYTAFISGRRIILTLREMDKIRKTMPVFTAGQTSKSAISISGIEMRSLQKNFEIDVTFTGIPQTASIYMLIDPERIIMDFNDVFIDTGFNMEINVPPVKSISLIKRDGENPYAGIIVNLNRKIDYNYSQEGKKLQVVIPWEGGLASRRGRLLLLGTGAIVAGGFVTGVLLSAEQDDPQPVTGKDDLGAPPDFPQGY